MGEKFLALDDPLKRNFLSWRLAIKSGGRFGGEFRGEPFGPIPQPISFWPFSSCSFIQFHPVLSSNFILSFYCFSLYPSIFNIFVFLVHYLRFLFVLRFCLSKSYFHIISSTFRMHDKFPPEVFLALPWFVVALHPPYFSIRFAAEGWRFSGRSVVPTYFWIYWLVKYATAVNKFVS